MPGPGDTLPAAPSSRAEAVEVLTFEQDERVIHDKYGLGRVVSVETDQAVVVDFGDPQVRLVRPFPKLSKL